MYSALSGQSVLVTGHTGFKGSWLVHWLAALGADVHGYALAPDPGGLFEVSGAEALLTSHVLADVRDIDALRAAIDAAQPTVVVHMAAQALVLQSYEAPKATFDINVGGTVNLLECLRHRPSVRATIVVTTDKCYENRDQVWGYRESDAMGGHDPYSASKGAAELVVQAWRKSFMHDRGLASARAGNVIGGGDTSDNRIVPDAIRALRAGTPIPVRNPAAVRPWQHVLEPLSGYLQLACALLDDPVAASGPWNFGPEVEATRPVSDLVEALLQHWGSGSWQSAGRADAPHEAHTLRLCVDKAHARLGWRPRWDLDQAVAHTVAWYRAQDAGKDLAGLCRAQIDTYVNG